MPDATPARGDVLFACFALAHSSVTRRLDDVRDARFRLSVFRSDTDKTQASLASRFLSADFPRLLARMVFGPEKVIWGWGPDVCLIASLAGWLRPDKTIVWDISDINPRFLGSGAPARVLRAIETLMLRRVACLVVSSERYYDRYFRGRIARERLRVVENLLPLSLQGPVTPPADDRPFRIVYSGIFRSRRLLAMIREVADAMGDSVRFDLYGYPDKTVGEAFLASICDGTGNVRFHGRYQQDELPAMHAASHLVFGCVDTAADENEAWLLNNRLYHALAFRRPILVNDGTYAGELVQQRRLGVTCALSAAAICATLRRLMDDECAGYRTLLEAMPDPAAAFLDGDYRRVLDEVIAARR